jgi:GTP 3',8-cyclase
MPKSGVSLKKHSEILSFEELIDIVSIGVELGIKKVRITGGEPLVRKGIVNFIGQLNAIDGIEDIGLTTNGMLLSGMAEELYSAGLSRVNISLDSVDPEKFRRITRYGDLRNVSAGIESALMVGMNPVKINFVLVPGINEDDKHEVREYCKIMNLQFRLIRQMNLEAGEFYPVEGGEGGVCSKCNRLRLTADGFLVSCLHSNERFNIREMGIEEAFNKAVYLKPISGLGVKNHQFYNIGG